MGELVDRIAALQASRVPGTSSDPVYMMGW